MVYGLDRGSHQPQNGVSHWGDTKVLISLGAALVLLGTFLFIESRSKHALMPLRIFSNRDRSAAFLILLCVGTALFGMFFFLTIFVQTVWGYSPIKTGLAYLPMIVAVMTMAGVSSQLVGRIGARPLLIASTGASRLRGMFGFLITEHSTYVGGLLGPTIVTAAGLGMLFMPLTLVSLSKVEDKDAGLASSLVNTGQQVGGSIGLAVLGTVAWTVVANTARNSRCGGSGGVRTRRQQLLPRDQANRGTDRRDPEGDHQSLPRGRVLPRLRGLGAHRADRAGRHAGPDPGHEGRPGRGHAADDGLGKGTARADRRRVPNAQAARPGAELPGRAAGLGCGVRLCS